MRKFIIYYNNLTGLNFAMRKIACFAKPKKTISIVDGRWTIVTDTSMSSNTVTFNLGEEFDEETVDGRNVKVHSISILVIYSVVLYMYTYLNYLIVEYINIYILIYSTII